SSPLLPSLLPLHFIPLFFLSSSSLSSFSPLIPTAVCILILSLKIHTCVDSLVHATHHMGDTDTHTHTHTQTDTHTHTPTIPSLCKLCFVFSCLAVPGRAVAQILRLLTVKKQLTRNQHVKFSANCLSHTAFDISLCID